MHVLNSEMIRKVDCYVEKHHDKFAKLGREIFEQFSSNSKENKVSTQVRNLQTITCSATRFADIEDFIKNQMGKRQENWITVGETALQQLSELRKESESYNVDNDDRLEIRLRLARSWVRAAMSEYLYQFALKQIENNS